MSHQFRDKDTFQQTITIMKCAHCSSAVLQHWEEHPAVLKWRQFELIRQRVFEKAYLKMTIDSAVLSSSGRYDYIINSFSFEFPGVPGCQSFNVGDIFLRLMQV